MVKGLIQTSLKMNSSESYCPIIQFKFFWNLQAIKKQMVLSHFQNLEPIKI